VHALWNKDARVALLEKAGYKYKDQFKYTMVVVGSKGKSMLEGVFLGSASQYLLHHSPIPVVVVR
jgi:nucleotide-binding universal stress UspA family protein